MNAGSGEVSPVATTTPVLLRKLRRFTDMEASSVDRLAERAMMVYNESTDFVQRSPASTTPTDDARARLPLAPSREDSFPADRFRLKRTGTTRSVREAVKPKVENGVDRGARK